MITIRMDYGKEYKFKEVDFFPGFVKVRVDKGIKLIPYGQIKHIFYDDKEYLDSYSEGRYGLTPYGKKLETKPVTEQSSEAKKPATKKPVANKKKWVYNEARGGYEIYWNERYWFFTSKKT